MQVNIANQQRILTLDRRRLRRTVQHVLRTVLTTGETTRARVSLALVDDECIRQLQERFLHTAQVTDVLSFDLRDSVAAQADGSLDCEVVVNAQQASRQAARRGGDAQAELHLYVVHGLLHQLGYDDREPSRARRMHAEEDRILEALGFGPVFGPPGKEG
ncbi:MAG: rRNA maturation RNase YbeY [Sedimentisphaerales bacterium]|nr:rRNA maturation RNase YbeY [Sedimentisphaerales bacterium]